MTKDQELLQQLKVPPLSLGIQDLRAALHGKLTLITAFTTPVSDRKLLEKLRRMISRDFMRNWPYETLADIQAARYARIEIMALECRVDTAAKDPTGGAS